MSATKPSQLLETDAWQLRVPDGLSQKSPLLVIPTVHPRGDRRILRCAQVALDAGFRVHFIWLGEGSRSEHPFVRETLLPSPADRWERMRMARKVGRIANLLDGQLWHIHDYYMLPVANRWSKKTGKRVLYDVHEYYGDEYASSLLNPEVLRPQAAKLIDAYQFHSAKRLGAANVVTEKMAGPFRDNEIPVTVSPNYPLLESFDTAPKIPFRERRWKTLHIGTLNPGYGTQLLIDLARRATERGLPFEFEAIARFHSDADETDFAERLAQAGNPNNLALVPSRSVHEMPAFMASGGFGLSLLSPGGQNEYSVPSKNFEHLMLGLVDVVSDRPGQRGFVEEYAVGVVGTEADPDGFLDRMLALANDPEVTESRLNAKIEQAREKFTWERAVAPALAASLQRLANTSPAE
ncbi:glycosyltransferase family protein [Gulosibacter chungangensis]|uniref:Glycosyltransferase family 4 protein n=1 Tax=Gulosibacter chungangensis TaxID=979746 RepID=A0A7J5B7L0_9MICO|nr:glycosyltransferase family 4 protein [Gulosibacter chungangensis]KAB1640987.1 glycosyltransferase family 4 protein [Gulosibacter chungangensis]